MIYLIKTPAGGIIGRLELSDDLAVVPDQPVQAPPAPPKTEVRHVMTEAAGPWTREDMLKQGWSDETLIAHGMMRVETVTLPAEPEQAQAGVHPSLEHQQLGAQWQAQEPQQQGPAVPPPPVEEPVQQGPAVPPPPAEEPVQQGPAVPPPPAEQSQQQGPAVPPPPAEQPHQQGPAVPPPPQEEQAPGDTPETPDGCTWLTTPPPRIEGREFIIRGKSYEGLQDKAKVLFDGRIHGLTAQNVPATKKDGTFKKKRNLDQAYYDKILAEQKYAIGGHASPAPTEQTQQGPGVPPPPTQGPGVPPPPQEQTGAVPPPPTTQGSLPQGGMVPPPPTAQGGTAPPPPANIQELEKELSDWGDEV